MSRSSKVLKSFHFHISGGINLSLRPITDVDVPDFIIENLNDTKSLVECLKTLPKNVLERVVEALKQFLDIFKGKLYVHQWHNYII